MTDLAFLNARRHRHAAACRSAHCGVSRDYIEGRLEDNIGTHGLADAAGLSICHSFYEARALAMLLTLAATLP